MMTRTLRVEQRRRAQRDEEEEGQEHDGGVAGRERAGGEDAAGDGGEQRPQHDEAEAARARSGAQVQFDDAPGPAHAEDRQRQHGEVDDSQQAALVGPRLQGRTLVVREAGESVDDGGEVGRRRPRGARVLGLVEECRHPGHEEQAANGHGDQRGPRRLLGTPVPATAHHRHDKPDAHHGHEVDGPVLGVEQCRHHDGDRDEVARTGRGDRPGQGEEAAAGQQDDQRVHAGLGGVVDREGRAGQEHEHRPGDRPAPEAPSAQPADRQREHGDHAGQGPHGVVGLSEEDDPEVQEVVVEGRCAVVLERVRDLVQRKAGDVDGQGLVEPEARAGPEAEDEPGGDHQPHEHAGNEARTTGESGNLLRHGAHGRTMGLRSRIIRRRRRPARGEGNRQSEGGKGAP